MIGTQAFPEPSGAEASEDEEDGGGGDDEDERWADGASLTTTLCARVHVVLHSCCKVLPSAEFRACLWRVRLSYDVSEKPPFVSTSHDFL